MVSVREGPEGRPAEDPLRAAFEAHYTRLVGLATVLTGRRQDAEDIVQDAFVKSAERIRGLADSEAGPYLRRAVLNIWKNRLRRLAVELRWRVATAGRHPPPEMEDIDAVWQAVLRLPTRQRACVGLRYYEDLTEAQTAAALGCSVGTVKSQTHKALRKLEELLKDG